jgi:transcriptional regulator with XRE-family HTH domain
MASQKEEEEKHQGRNLKRFREMLGLKQEYLADRLGPGWSQKRISLLEGKEFIDDATLAEVAVQLEAPPDIIRFFSERVARECLLQLYAQRPDAPAATVAFSSAAPADTIDNNPLQAFLEQHKTLVQEHKRLYEELLLCERKHSATLEKLLSTKEAQVAGA